MRQKVFKFMMLPLLPLLLIQAVEVVPLVPKQTDRRILQRMYRTGGERHLVTSRDTTHLWAVCSVSA